MSQEQKQQDQSSIGTTAFARAVGETTRPPGDHDVAAHQRALGTSHDEEYDGMVEITNPNIQRGRCAAMARQMG